MAGIRTDVKVTGLEELHRALEGLQGVELQKAADGIGRSAATGTLARVIRGAAPVGDGSGGDYRDPRAARRSQDRKHLRDTVTARRIRRRNGELFAYGVGPRKFTRYWVVRGTRPHVIKGPSRLGGRWVSDIHHPGATANPFVFRAGRSRGATAATEVAKAFDRYVARVMKQRAKAA